MDRFEFQGNLPDVLIDDFDDGQVSPWLIEEPTVTEANGLLTFSNPGEIQPPIIVNNLSIVPEYSYAKTPSLPYGGGDFSGRSTWLPTVPGLNQFYNMNFSFDETELEVAIGVGNFETALANVLGTPAGLVIFFVGFEIEGDVLPRFEGISIEETAIQNRIVLELVFDDTGKTFNGRFSLDGGLNFQRPFTPFAPTIEITSSLSGRWYLGAESLEVKAVPEPTTFLLISLGLGGLFLARRAKKWPVANEVTHLESQAV